MFTRSQPMARNYSTGVNFVFAAQACAMKTANQVIARAHRSSMGSAYWYLSSIIGQVEDALKPAVP
jgi:hypothetical protein